MPIIVLIRRSRSPTSDSSGLGRRRVVFRNLTPRNDLAVHGSASISPIGAGAGLKDPSPRAGAGGRSGPDDQRHCAGPRAHEVSARRSHSRALSDAPVSTNAGPRPNPPHALLLAKQQTPRPRPAEAQRVVRQTCFHERLSDLRVSPGRFNSALLGRRLRQAARSSGSSHVRCRLRQPGQNVCCARPHDPLAFGHGEHLWFCVRFSEQLPRGLTTCFVRSA